VATAARGHRWQEAHDQPQAAEVVQLHDPLIIMEPVVGEIDGPSNGAPGIIDQDIDRAHLRENLFEYLVTGLHFRKVR